MGAEKRFRKASERAARAASRLRRVERLPEAFDQHVAEDAREALDDALREWSRAEVARDVHLAKKARRKARRGR